MRRRHVARLNDMADKVKAMRDQYDPKDEAVIDYFLLDAVAITISQVIELHKQSKERKKQQKTNEIA